MVDQYTEGEPSTFRRHLPGKASDSSSRNDLFNASWAPEVPPPRPLASTPSTPVTHATTTPAFCGSDPQVSFREGSSTQVTRITEFGSIISQQAGSSSKSGANSDSPRTSSFFDAPIATPLPAPRLPPAAAPLPNSSTSSGLVPPSPLNLSRSNSLRNRVQAPPALPLDHSSSTVQRRSQPFANEPLSPLHQSPSLPPVADWMPPAPPSSDDISLRLTPRSTYLLGEGRYAAVFLGSYKRDDRKGKSKSRSMMGTGRYIPPTAKQTQVSELGDCDRINEEGDGLVGGSWRLCAAKRMAPDRESQTMGLREAFFLHRIAGSDVRGTNRAVSPLRDGLSRSDRASDYFRLDNRMSSPSGNVYVVKLIAVKEDTPTKSSHSRSISDVQKTSGIQRQRSSTLLSSSSSIRDSSPQTRDEATSPLNSFPSLPSLGNVARTEMSTPALTRLVLVLEHAPLGTMDRLLRTSPHLVGRDLWERWARQGAVALEWVHAKGIVHADVKPGNLLLTVNLDLRLSDFGSSLLIHPSHPPTDGVGLGTLPFSPPELVDPEQSFSFPVDIFAFGATLYQCITGREPYRGSRTVEMMHQVRRGKLWMWEERERLGRVGQGVESSVAPSPYPSAWRADDTVDFGVKRGGSLRVPTVVSKTRPRLARMSSTESLRASEDLAAGSPNDSPPGVKLWANWMKYTTRNGKVPSSDPVSVLLSEGDQTALPVANASVSRQTSLRVTVPSRQPSLDSASSSPSSPDDPHVPPPSMPSRFEDVIPQPYSDGSPAMFFLDGVDRVDERVREVLKAMLAQAPEDRPSARELMRIWDELGVHVEPKDRPE